MDKNNPYDIVISRYVTEKAVVLSQLHSSDSNKCLKKCQTPKYVFLVNPKANKAQIAKAVEEIYSEKKIKVIGVNTVTLKPKAKRVRGKAKYGKTGRIKKAVVTLDVGDIIED